MACLKSRVAALVTSHMNGLKPFERTLERTTERITPNSKTITAVQWRQIELQASESCYQVTEDCRYHDVTLKAAEAGVKAHQLPSLASCTVAGNFVARRWLFLSDWQCFRLRTVRFMLQKFRVRSETSLIKIRLIGIVVVGSVNN